MKHEYLYSMIQASKSNSIGINALIRKQLDLLFELDFIGGKYTSLESQSHRRIAHCCEVFGARICLTPSETVLGWAQIATCAIFGPANDLDLASFPSISNLSGYSRSLLTFDA